MLCRQTCTKPRNVSQGRQEERHHIKTSFELSWAKIRDCGNVQHSRYVRLDRNTGEKIEHGYTGEPEIM
jgi:hypothetical protein